MSVENDANSKLIVIVVLAVCAIPVCARGSLTWMIFLAENLWNVIGHFRVLLAVDIGFYNFGKVTFCFCNGTKSMNCQLFFVHYQRLHIQLSIKLVDVVC